MEKSPIFPAGTEITAELTNMVKGCHSIFIGDKEFFPIAYRGRVLWSLIEPATDAVDMIIDDAGVTKTERAWQ